MVTSVSHFSLTITIYDSHAGCGHSFGDGDFMMEVQKSVLAHSAVARQPSANLTSPDILSLRYMAEIPISSAALRILLSPNQLDIFKWLKIKEKED